MFLIILTITAISINSSNRLVLLMDVQCCLIGTNCIVGAFVKLREVITSFIMSVHLSDCCPSVRVEQLDFHWTDFCEI